MAEVERDRAAGRTVAFANGCFDLLHVGHVRYLQAAAREADRLVVAINDDRSVAELKGPNRPLLSETDRAELVAALRGVDYVVIFSEPTVTPLLLALKPDVHCKGPTTPRHRARTQAVRGYGGRIAIVGDRRTTLRDLEDALAAAERSRRRSMNILIVRLGALGDVVRRPAAARARRFRPLASTGSWTPGTGTSIW